MNEALKFDRTGLDLTETSEELRLEAYPDPATGSEPWTIGWGHTGPDIHKGMKITRSAAEMYLMQDIERCETAIYGLVQVPLTQYEFDALVDFVFNVGVGHFKSSTLLTLINKGQFVEASKEFSKWVYAGGRVLPGLVTRRSKEAQLFNA
jgi:lysozyme